MSSEDIEEAKIIAEKVGYPVLIKAAGGGGGKGMKIVFESKDLEKNIIDLVSAIPVETKRNSNYS